MKILSIFFSVFLMVALPFAAPISVAAETDATNAPSLPQTDWSRVFFLGESTTAHLRRRGTLLGTYAKSNVIAPDSGTMMLSSRTLAQTVRKSGTNEKISVLESIREEQPPVLILSFGLNGIVGFHANENRYLRLYANLIDEIRKASSDTLLVLQTIYPVAKRQVDWKFAASPETVNLWIDSLNERLSELCAEKNSLLWDTAALLKDENGFLKAEFSDDGIHLTNAGYDLVLRKIAENTEKLQR